jgi:hypothetical protein
LSIPPLLAAGVFNLPSHRSPFLFFSLLLRQDSASQEPDIDVGTPRRGNTQRIKTRMYAAKNATNQSQSGISWVSYRSMLGKPAGRLRIHFTNMPSTHTAAACDGY